VSARRCQPACDQVGHVRHVRLSRRRRRRRRALLAAANYALGATLATSTSNSILGARVFDALLAAANDALGATRESELDEPVGVRCRSILKSTRTHAGTKPVRTHVGSKAIRPDERID
jgi:hypothetical protein